MADLMGVFDSNGGGGGDLMNGFAGLDIGGSSQPPPPQTQLHGGEAKKTNEDLLGMF